MRRRDKACDYKTGCDRWFAILIASARNGRFARSQNNNQLMNRGTLAAAGAYLFWGVLPLYWRLLGSVPALEILAHRVWWALLLVVALLAYQRRWHWLLRAVRSPRIMLTFCATTALLAVNWFIYLWAVQAGHVVEASLGYFINPLLNVVLGVIVLHERLRSGQLLAVLLAACGVLAFAWALGAPPWIALSLALTFGAYGLLRKLAALGSLEGLALEMLLAAGPALAYLLWLQRSGTAAFGSATLAQDLLLVGCGLVTAVPLLLFASGARRVSLVTLGLLQYTAPTLQFLLGVFVFGEAQSPQRLAAFGLIWLALLLYSAEAIGQQRAQAGAPAL